MSHRSTSPVALPPASSNIARSTRDRANPMPRRPAATALPARALCVVGRKAKLKGISDG